MSMKLLTVVAVLAVLAMSAMVAMTADGEQRDRPRHDVDPAQRWAKLLEHADANNDGTISKDEFKGPDEAFDRMDKNGDGALTEDEVTAAGDHREDRDGERQGHRRMSPEERWAHMLERFDADEDGKISEAEFEGPDRVFGFLDRDGDGVITEKEGKQGGPGGQPGARRNQDPAAHFAKMLENWDADGDGQISKGEWQGPPEAFEQFDGDGDASITEQEFVAGAEQMRRRHNPMEAIINAWDTDGDGRVSEDEWATFFAAADENEDGFLSQDELMKALRPPRPDAPAPPAPPQ